MKRYSVVTETRHVAAIGSSHLATMVADEPRESILQSSLACDRRELYPLTFAIDWCPSWYRWEEAMLSFVIAILAAVMSDPGNNAGFNLSSVGGDVRVVRSIVPSIVPSLVPSVVPPLAASVLNSTMLPSSLQPTNLPTGIQSKSKMLCFELHSSIRPYWTSCEPPRLPGLLFCCPRSRSQSSISLAEDAHKASRSRTVFCVASQNNRWDIVWLLFVCLCPKKRQQSAKSFIM